MNRAGLLEKRFREVALDGKWVTGTNFKEQLSEIDWQDATKKIAQLNTIAQITFHVHYYIAGLLEYFETGNLTIRDKYSFDMEPVKSEEDWQELKTLFISDAEKFANKTGSFTEEELNNVFFDEKYGDIHRNIDVIIEHCYYHFGQLMLIRKMLGEGAVGRE